MTDLEAFQRELLDRIRRPEGAEERLAIYADLSFGRQLAALAVDYPALAHVMGERSFTDAAVAYLGAHPSRSYRLADLGAALPGHLAAVADLPGHDLLADLARLERAIREVEGERDAPRLDPGTLAALSPDDWAAARFRTLPAFRLLAVGHPLVRFHDAVLAGREPRPPGRRATRIVVWRPALDVLRREVEPEQHAILTALAAGRPLEEALAAALALPGADSETLGTALGDWFRGWTEDGFFTAIERA